MVVGVWTAFATGLVRAQPAAAPNSPDATFQVMVGCLARGQEIVMVAPRPECRSYGEGAAIAEASRIPFGAREGDWDRICQANDDPRRLAPDAIKRVATQKDIAIAPTGIRIIGAVFCRGVDLVGLDLPYSIVIDHSVVEGNIDARNLRVKGDFSFEYAVVLGKVLLNRTHVEGSVYAGTSFAEELLVSDHPDRVRRAALSDVLFRRQGPGLAHDRRRAAPRRKVAGRAARHRRHLHGVSAGCNQHARALTSLPALREKRTVEVFGATQPRLHHVRHLA
jgi:hypothetical protein